MAKSKDKGGNRDTLKPKKGKALDMRPHEVQRRAKAMLGGAAAPAR